MKRIYEPNIVITYTDNKKCIDCKFAFDDFECSHELRTRQNYSGKACVFWEKYTYDEVI